MNILFLKVISFGNYTALEMTFPVLITALEHVYWNIPQMVGFNLLHVSDCAKMSSLEVLYESKEDEKVTRTQMNKDVERHRNIFFFWPKMCLLKVRRRIVVM